MRYKPETVAWASLGSSFVVFLLLCSSLAFAVNWYKDTATSERGAHLTIISGTVLVQGKGQPSWVRAVDEMELVSGDAVRTEERSEALIVLFDKSTVFLFPETELALTKLAVSRFAPLRHTVVLSLHRGKSRIGVSLSPLGEKQFLVRGLQGTARLDEGSYAMTVDNRRDSFRVRENGRAVVTARGESVALSRGERTEVQRDAPPTSPRSGLEELVFNGSFTQGLTGWQVGNELGFPEGQDVQGDATLVREEGRPAVLFSRRGSKGTHCESYIFQEINRDVSDFAVLRLYLRLKLFHQSLSGGGYMGSEYPVLVKIKYQVAQGENFEVYGFYYQNEAHNRTDNGTQVAQNTWVAFTAPENLMTLIPQPRKIISIEVQASGWDYESLVSDVSLLGE